MKVSALQEFLRNLGGALGALGVQVKSLEDLRSVSRAFEPFKDLDLEQVADFLTRAAAYRRDGTVPAVTVVGLDDATAAARGLSESVQTLSASGGDVAEADVVRGKKALQTALGRLAGEFGLTASFKDDKKWLAGVQSKATVARVVEALNGLKPQLTSPESYQSDAVRSAIDALAKTDTKFLKAAAAELGISGTGTGKKLVESLLAALTGVSTVPAKGSKKADGPTASDEQVEALIKSLENMVERSRDPDAVADAEIDAILARLGMEFSTDQQKSIAKRVTGKGGKSAKEAANLIRIDLTAVKRLRETQRV